MAIVGDRPWIVTAMSWALLASPCLSRGIPISYKLATVRERWCETFTWIQRQDHLREPGPRLSATMQLQRLATGTRQRKNLAPFIASILCSRLLCLTCNMRKRRARHSHNHSELASHPMYGPSWQ